MRSLMPYRCFFEGGFSVLACRLLGSLAELRVPRPLLEPFVKAYVAWFGVEMSEVLVPPGGFCSFGAFFARSLRPGARPVCTDPEAVVSPCDGVVAGLGRIEEAAVSVIVVKNTAYRIGDLVADAAVAGEMLRGGYCVLYLHPRDYHRVHIPADSTLREVRHIPGARYPVAPWSSRLAEGVLGKNERVAFELNLSDNGSLCVMLMVAAFGVGGIECRHVVRKGRLRNAMQRTACHATLQRGDEVGAFRIGSTVVLLWPEDAVDLDNSLSVGNRVFAGQRIGRARCPA